MIKTRVVAVAPREPDPEVLSEAAAVLLGGGLVAFATETVYGLGAVATDADAVLGIFRAKGRPSNNPLIVHVADIAQARGFALDWDDRAEVLARRFWPGPLTLVLPRTEAIPDIVAGGGPTVGLRVPAPTVARRLIECVGLPLAAPSANRSNRISPTRAEHVLADLDGRVHLILDSGPTTLGLESTVLDLASDPPAILRPGPIGRETLSAALQTSIAAPRRALREQESGPLPSPGQLSVHYAPRTHAIRVESPEALARIDWPARAGLLAFVPIAVGATPEGVERRILAEPESAARGFYDALHELDDRRLDLIVTVEPPAGEEWDAVRDRLSRATLPY
ncbi:L-threonylcarbamoyladenylate synthase [Planctomyces sp. SH-PL62]|uniref:L-threonylcarbamoyladenylate synthase n=1 Tax=Planctomyces sp. SH-PL62 TaxID=1636152 RepID=UPI00078CE9E2|nr:L-threonylcarbamoyladenylate synthase [Planctomyces sp. SH-PL62]AMV36995.1 Threonylcarbamoyl-AMP synthase [Planctomyces sp. SH-PL62]